MKVLVQNPLTLSYVGQAGRWTPDPDLAHSFNNSRSAIQFCLDHGLEDVEVVVKTGDRRHDVSLPVVPRGPRDCLYA